MKYKFQIGDTIQSTDILSIINTDDTQEVANINDIFIIIEDKKTKNNEMAIFRQKSLKTSIWFKDNLRYHFTKV